jgi:hypothetical protein
MRLMRKRGFSLNPSLLKNSIRLGHFDLLDQLLSLVGMVCQRIVTFRKADVRFAELQVVQNMGINRTKPPIICNGDRFIRVILILA